MATVTSNPGATHPDTTFYDVDIDDVTVSNSSTYSWDTWTSSTSGIVESKVTLLGSFTYDGAGNLELSSTIAQVLIDADADGTTDLTVAYSAFTGGLIAGLTSENLHDFFGALFFQDDDITLAGQPISPTRDFYLGGTGLESNDTVLITGSGEYGGDGRFGAGKTGGNDNFTIDSTATVAQTFVIGDFRTEDGTTSTGGNDTLTDISGAGAALTILVGDVERLENGTLNGGDDLIKATNRDGELVGDARFLTQTGGTLNGGNDTILGGSGEDTIYGDYRDGLSSSATYTVNGGNDSLVGGDGDDLIFGEGDREGGSGLVVETGGVDTIRGGNGNDTIYGGSGDDFIFGDNDDDVLIGGSGVDVYAGGNGIDTVDFSASLFGLTAVLADGAGSGTLTSGGDVETAFGIENIRATTVNDDLTGNSDNNEFTLYGGNDTVDGGGGLDTVNYADATSALTVDLALTGVGQAIGGGQGTDNLTSIEGVIGSDFNDTIYGGAGNDSILGGDGDDTLVMTSSSSGFVFSGTDTIDGGRGSDVIGFGLGSGAANLTPNNVFHGGSTGTNIDTFVFEAFGGSYTVALDTSGNGVFVSDSDGMTYATLTGFEAISGGAGNDTLSIGLTGSGTSTVANIDGGGGNDLIQAEAFFTTLDGGSGNDTVIGSTNNDTLYGGVGNDSLSGGLGADTLRGENGADSLDGGLAGDDMRGGLGNDVYTVDDLDDLVVEGVGEGLDTVYSSVTIRLGANLERLTLTGAAADDLEGRGNAETNLIIGDTGDNTLDGISGADTLRAGDGDDTLFDRDGGDSLFGGDGDDSYLLLSTGSATITERLNEGLDSVRFEGSYDLGANIENFTILGTGDFDSTGNGLANIISGNAGDNVLVGGGAADRLNGNAGLDTLIGDNGNDFLFGGASNDVLDGGDGSDRLDGQGGADNLTGGANTDFFIFRDAFSFDTITDFGNGADRINLIDVREENGGARLTLDHLLLTQIGTRTRIELDLNQDGTADLLDMDGNGSLDAVRIDVLNTTATSFVATDFLF